MTPLYNFGRVYSRGFMQKKLKKIYINLLVSTIPSTLQGTTVGATVFTVTATDADDGLNGQVSFRLISPSELFVIEPAADSPGNGGGSAVVKLSKALDYEVAKSHVLTIQAYVSLYFYLCVQPRY